MSTKISSLLQKGASVLVIAVLLFANTSFTKADQVDDAMAKAVVWLKSQPVTPDSTMALVAALESVDVEYLKGFSGNSAIAYAKPIMALAAAGKNPATFPNESFVTKMKSFAYGTQLGNADQINDDIWGILALISAGVPVNDSAIQNSKIFILNNQNSDGGWAWNVGGTSDTNDSAAAISALLEAGVSRFDAAIQKAISYLKAAQNTDGGFPYDPQGESGTDSDGNSDAWVIMALNKLGEDPRTWTKNGKNPVQHLLSLQDEDGGFWWMPEGTAFTNKGATADATIALSGKSFPVGRLTSAGVFFRIVGSRKEICRGAINAETALDMVIRAADQCGYTHEIQDTSFGPYLIGIASDKAEGLKGWLYRVDGVLPNVGAADFVLLGGESVLWYYGESDDEPPALGGASDSVELAVEIVKSGGGGGGGGGETPEIPEMAFTVTPSALNFGKLVPGNSVVNQVALKNEGQRNLNVKAEVKGNEVFHFLKIETVLWNLFQTTLSAGAQKNIGVQLSLPSGFNSFGQKQGTLIFWGTAE